MKIIYQNKLERKFQIIQTEIVGIVLKGEEIKFIRKRDFNLKNCYASFQNGLKLKKVILGNLPPRDILFLMTSSQKNRWFNKIKKTSLTVFVTKVLLIRGLIKFELSLVKMQRNFRSNVKKDTIDYDI